MFINKRLSTLVVLSGLVFFHATTAHAATMVVSNVWTHESDPSLTVFTQAFFDPAFLSTAGVVLSPPGIEAVQIEVLTLQFSHRAFLQTADIVLADPYPEGSPVAVYVDGAFSHIESVEYGGNPAIGVTPDGFPIAEGIIFPTFPGGIGNAALPVPFLLDVPGGYYFLTSSTGPTLVPPVGQVPNGGTLPGVPLTVERDPGGSLLLSWGASCTATDTDYEIYEGVLGDFASHVPSVCSTGGATSATVPMPDGSAYYLIVPRTDYAEGAYGQDSSGSPRPAGLSVCLLQDIGAGCP